MKTDVNPVAPHAMEVGVCSYKTAVLDELRANQIKFKTAKFYCGNLFLLIGLGLFCLCFVWVLLADGINIVKYIHAGHCSSSWNAKPSPPSHPLVRKRWPNLKETGCPLSRSMNTIERKQKTSKS